MPIIVMNARTPRATVAHESLSVSIAPVPGAALQAHGRAGQAAILQTGPYHLLLPHVDEPVSVSVVPTVGDRFAAGTVVHLVLAHDTANPDPTQVIFDAVDVSGEPSAVLANLTPAGRDIIVTIHAVSDTPMSPLAAAARTAARQFIARDRPPATAPVVLACDASASMQRWFADGTVTTAAEIVAGVADAAGYQQATAVLVGVGISPLPGPQTPAGLADTVAAAAPRWSAGTRWSRLSPTAGHIITCTDRPTGAATQSYPMVVISDDPRHDALGARLPAAAHRDAAAELLADPARLAQLAGYLVKGLI